MLKKKSKKPTSRLFIFQLSVIASMIVMAWPFFGRFAALSAGGGGLVCLFPNWVFSILLFRYRGALQAKQILLSLYLGEVIKILVTISLFVVVFHYLKLAPLAFFIGFIIVQLTFWLAPWLVK